MRWKLLVLVSIVAALIASATWFLLIFLFFNGSESILPLNGELWPLSLILPFLLTTTFAAFFVYRHTSRKRKTQAAITVLAVLTLTALMCFAVLGLLRTRQANFTVPVLLWAPTQSPSAPASAHQSQIECAHPTRRLIPGHPDGYLHDSPTAQRLCPSTSS